MQKYIKSDTDTRTFQDIWSTLTPAERCLLKANLAESLHVSVRSVENWGKGMAPVSRGSRENAAKVVNYTFGLKTHYVTLFPLARG